MGVAKASCFRRATSTSSRPSFYSAQLNICKGDTNQNHQLAVATGRADGTLVRLPMLCYPMLCNIGFLRDKKTKTEIPAVSSPGPGPRPSPSLICSQYILDAAATSAHCFRVLQPLPAVAASAHPVRRGPPPASDITGIVPSMFLDGRRRSVC